MSLLVLGLSHRNAPLEVLERAALDPAARADVAAVALAGDHVREILVLSTCNRTEVFAEVTAFHPAVDTLRDALTSRTALNRDDLREHLVLHYDEGAVEHAFSLAAGLDSMAVGEAQILGQLRSALAEGQEREETGPSLNALVQQALRVGKRVHSETEIDTVSRSLVQAGLDRAFPAIGASSPADVDVLVVGAGSMSALAATTAVRAGVRSLTVVNRTAARASDLAQRLGGSSIDIADLADGIARADIVISCTGSTGVVVDLATATDAQIGRSGGPLDVQAQQMDVFDDEGRILSAQVEMVSRAGFSADLSAPVMARTTTTRCAPAATTSGKVWASMPPIANHGLRRRGFSADSFAATSRTRSRPGAGRPGLVGVGQHGPVQK